MQYLHLQTNKNIHKVYVDLDYYVTPTRLHFNNENSKKCRIDEIIEITNNNIIILGQPGAGKTTTVKKLIQTFLTDDANYLNNRFRACSGILFAKQDIIVAS